MSDTSGFPNILVVEDDSAIATAIAERFSFEGWKTIVVNDGTDVMLAFEQENFDAVIMDIMLPGINGISLVEQIREISTVPIIMLTARTDIDDELESLEMGADDFLRKPLRPSILVAHVKVWLKRYEHIKKMLDNKTDGVITVGEFAIDEEKHTAYKIIDDEPEFIKLTKHEYLLLQAFMRSPNEPIERSVIQKEAWGWSDSEDSRVVDSYIKFLRKKIGTQYIETVHGFGYRFLPEGSATNSK
jgi:DNA-binding response OmpR family regulator